MGLASSKRVLPRHALRQRERRERASRSGRCLGMPSARCRAAAADAARDGARAWHGLLGLPPHAIWHALAFCMLLPGAWHLACYWLALKLKLRGLRMPYKRIACLTPALQAQVAVLRLLMPCPRHAKGWAWLKRVDGLSASSPPPSLEHRHS